MRCAHPSSPSFEVPCSWSEGTREMRWEILQSAATSWPVISLGFASGGSAGVSRAVVKLPQSPVITSLGLGEV